MCTNPHKIDADTTVACRRCDECLSTHKNDWIVRCMAEKQTSGFAYAVTLTYRNLPSGNMPDGAKVFNYGHVRTFMNSLRVAYRKAYNATGQISFIAVGEFGSQKKRAHWHLIIFSQRPLSNLSQFKTPSGVVQPLSMDKRMIWGLWPHGVVFFQKPDASGMAYALKYAMKAQYTSERSKGSGRFHKADNFGSGMFRMSKAPPIGWRFLVALCDSWEQRQVVPTSLNIKVPDYKGYWFLKRQFREYAALRIHKINEQRRFRTGSDCVQMSSLLAHLYELEDLKTLEIIYYGEQEKQAFNDARSSDNLPHNTFQPYSGIPYSPRDRCFELTPCAGCARVANFDRLARFVRQQCANVSDETRAKFPNLGATDHAAFEWEKRQTRNPFCKGSCSGSWSKAHP